MDISDILFSLKKIITLFILPPGIFIIALLALGWHLWRKNQKTSACYIFFIASSLWFLSTGFVSNILMKELEKELVIPKKPVGDVIILLGGGINDKAPDLTGVGTPSEAMMSRMVTAVRLQRQLNIPILVTGGSPRKEGISEAEVVRRFMIDLGVSDKDILIEKKSRDTTENVRFSKEILKQHNFKLPLIVTSAYHIKRSVQAFKREGIEVTPVPANFISKQKLDTIQAMILPGMSNLNDSYLAMKEHLGLIFYKLGGK